VGREGSGEKGRTGRAVVAKYVGRSFQHNCGVGAEKKKNKRKKKTESPQMQVNKKRTRKKWLLVGIGSIKKIKITEQNTSHENHGNEPWGLV